jgi:TonB family protein
VREPATPSLLPSVAGAVLVAVVFGAAAQAAPEVTRPPEVLSSVPPVYPEAARRERRGGAVSLLVTLDADGAVMRVEVVESAGADLDWAALGALTQYAFRPAEIDGRPAAVAITYRLLFEVPAHEAPAPRDARATAPDEGRPAFSLSGRVRRAGTVQPVRFAEVIVSELLPEEAGGLGAPVAILTDDEGRFAFPPLPEGPYRLEVGVEGYEPFRDEQYLAAGERHDLDVALAPRQANDFETVVRRQRGEPPVSRVSLSREEVRAIPGTYGDALRVIESLPGVARAPLFGGALMVRGGYPADTAIHFEGVPIPVLYHFGGFTSVVNGAFIEEISFMPGGFPVRYGNATAGIVDVRAHALENDTFKAHFDVDGFDFGFFFGGHVKPSFGDLALDALPELKIGFAARRSHTEIPGNLFLAAAQAFGQPIPFLPVPLYYDYQLKLEADLTPRSTVSLFVFGAEDSWAVLGDAPAIGTNFDGEDLRLDGILNTFLGNRFHRFLGSWELRPLPGVTHTLRPYVGMTRRGLLSDGVVVPLLTGATLDSPTDELNWGLRDELAVRLTPWLRGLFGFEHHGAAYRIDLLPGGDLFGIEAPEGVATGANASLSTAALYTELQLGPMAGLSVVPGFRAELSSLALTEENALPVYGGSARSAVDSWTFDPRVALRYVVHGDLALKAAGGLFHRRPRAASAAADQDGEALRPPGALQLIGGFEARLTELLTLDAQVYGVRRFDLTRDRSRRYQPRAPQGGLPPAAPAGTAGFDSFGTGNTIGLELLLRSPPTRRFFGWVSYTLSRTEVSLGETRERRVAFAFDQTHNLVAVGRVNLPWEVTFGGRFALVTGNPGIIPDAIATRHDLNGNWYEPVLSSLQPSRLQPFHRLDLRIDKRFIREWWSGVVFLEVINVYNWPNPEVVFPGGDYRARELRTLLPGPPLLPLLGAELDL